MAAERRSGQAQYTKQSPFSTQIDPFRFPGFADFLWTVADRIEQALLASPAIQAEVFEIVTEKCPFMFDAAEMNHTHPPFHVESLLEHERPPVSRLDLQIACLRLPAAYRPIGFALCWRRTIRSEPHDAHQHGDAHYSNEKSQSPHGWPPSSCSAKWQHGGRGVPPTLIRSRLA